MRLSIVCYLDPESTALVRNIQQDLAEITRSMASLELWKPHVTVGDGVEVGDEELLSLRDRLQAASAERSPFRADFYGIIKMDTRKGGKGEKTTPYGLYLDVKPNNELLELVSDVSRASRGLKKWYFMPQPYHPHCALAFKDLTKEGFYKGIDYLNERDLKLTVTLDHVALVEMLPESTRELISFNLGK